MLVISVMVAMLKALREMGADYKMFSPLRKLIRSPMQACFVLDLAATAGIASVSPVELARRNFVPVICGLCATALVAIVIM